MIRMTTKNDLPLLKEFLRKKLPSSMSVLMCIEMAVKFEVSRRIYVTTRDPTLFIFVCDISTSQHPTFCAFWDRERLTSEDTKSCIKSVPWDWNQGFQFCRMDSALALELDQMIRENELSFSNFNVTQHVRCFNFEMAFSSLPETECPKGFKFGELKPHHASLLLASWKFGKGRNIDDFKECLRKLPTSALFKEEDEEAENPVSWSILFSYGSIGMTHTRPEFRRLGLAKAALVNLCRKLMEKKMPINCEAETDNKESITMLQKIGFKIIGEITWITYDPES